MCTQDHHRRVLLARHKSNQQEHSIDDTNIFANMRATQPLPKVSKIIGNEYDVVGPKAFKQKLLEPKQQKANQSQQEQQTGFNETGFNSNMMNTTINKQTMMSKMTREQVCLLEKDGKHMSRYKEVQNQWQRDSERLRRLVHRKNNQKTLLQNNVKDLYVHPNHQKIAVLNDFVVHFWEMSLRNNNRILERHIKGHRFNRVELEELLQLQEGTKKVQRSIPKLPIGSLKNIGKRDLSLTGRNKAMSETQGASFTSARFGGTKNSVNQQEVFKVNYDGPVKWMSSQGL